MKMFIQDIYDSVYELLIDFDLLSSYLRKCFDIVNIYRSMPSAIKLIVNLEYPCIDIEIVCNQFCQLKHKFLLIVNIYGTDRSWDICQRKDLFCT